MPDLCYNCFKEEAENGICTNCRYNSSNDEGKYCNALKHGSILNGRYVTGRVIHQSRCITSYIAEDYKTKDRVYIRECFPIPMAVRSQKNEVALTRPEISEEFYSIKRGLYLEAKILSKLDNLSNIAHVRDFFEENGTVYMVADYAYGINLAEYLKVCGGKIEPTDAMKLLKPVSETLSAMHDKNIIHRNIAPENIIITKGRIPVLVGFGEAKNIAENGNITLNEINKNLRNAEDRQQISDFLHHDGYAAVEQYSTKGKQSYYTDVYAFAAVVYFAITGNVPAESIERMGNDELLPPSSYGMILGTKAENALMKALSVTPQDRYATIKEFMFDFKIDGKVKKSSPEILPHTDLR